MATFFVKRSVRIPAGSDATDFPIPINVSQKDFPSVEEELNYKIYRESVAIGVVQGEIPIPPSQPSIHAQIEKPLLSFGATTDGQIVAVPRLSNFQK